MRTMNKFLFMLMLLMSCSKQEFQTNKGSQSSSISAATTSCSTLYSQSTLIKPKVDILMVWDNTSSFNFVTSATKSSMSNLISSVSENFDYHVLSVPLVPASSTTLYESTLIASDSTSVSGTATSILKTKDAAISSLGFTQGTGGSEAGISRVYDVLTANRSNGIFRDGAYTIIVMMSNEDDKGCELSTGYNSCTQTDNNNYLAPYKQKLLCLRGATSAYSCSGYSTLNSTMMRFINISPLTACSSGLNKINYNYKTMAKFIYESTYNNGWPTSSDHLNPDVSGYPDSYNLCTIDFSHIFDGVNAAIKQTLLKHVYSYWPVASSSASVDPDTLYVTTSSGKVLTNNTCVYNNNCSATPTSGFGYIGAQTNHATRTYPSEGEYYTGKMIQLYGSNGSDLVVYPTSLTVCYQEVKSKYGYVYLSNGEPTTSTIEVTINGSVVPQSSTNGWSYMGLQTISALDSTYKVANLPATVTSGYIIKLNGTYQVTNSSSISISVYYTSKAN